MASNKRLIAAGAATGAAAAFDPYQNFEVVTYTGNGGTQKITGYIRKGAAFNGSSSYIQSTSLNYSTLPTNTAWSASCWINLGSTSIFTTAISLMNAANPFTGWALVVENGIVKLGVNGSTPTAASGSFATLSANTWMHVVLSYNGSGTTTIYYNGSFGATVSATIGASTNGNFRIGYAGVWSYFNGKIDQVRIFNKAISSSEVTTLYGETYASSTKSTTDIFGDGSGVALYQLDDNANDTGNTGTAIDSGQSASFNGSSRIDLGNNSSNNSSTFSVSLWFRTDGHSGTATIINNGGANSNETGYYLGLTSDGYIKFSTNTTSSGYVINGSIDYADGLWHHILLTYDSGTWNIYVDGNTTPVLGNSSGTFTGTASRPTWIGQFSYTPSSIEFFNGQIDQVRLYTSALSSSNVTNLYNESSVPTPAAWYKLDGNATDSQGSNNGTWNGTEAYSNPAKRGQTSYNGTATNVNFLGMAFQPDLVWQRYRSISYDHYIMDSVRGGGKYLSSNNTLAEANLPNAITFDSNGFTIGGSPFDAALPQVAWCWKAGGASALNEEGSINSQVSANQAAGFSIVKWTAPTDYTQTVGHGLSQAPELVITKNLGSSINWYVFYDVVDGSVDYMSLNTTGSYGNTTAQSFTSTTIKSWWGVTENIIAYCFHSVTGYQKIGTYSGTNSSQSITGLGFAPRFVMLKNTTGVGPWVIHDTSRNPSNPSTKHLRANTSGIEDTGAGEQINFDSDGFTINYNGCGNINCASNTFLYLAIA